MSFVQVQRDQFQNMSIFSRQRSSQPVAQLCSLPERWNDPLVLMTRALACLSLNVMWWHWRSKSPAFVFDGETLKLEGKKSGVFFGLPAWLTCNSSWLTSKKSPVPSLIRQDATSKQWCLIAACWNKTKGAAAWKQSFFFFPKAWIPVWFSKYYFIFEKKKKQALLFAFK